MYKISSEQIKTLLQIFYDINAPVKMFDYAKNILSNLEVINQDIDKKTEPKTEEKNAQD